VTNRLRIQRAICDFRCVPPRSLRPLRLQLVLNGLVYGGLIFAVLPSHAQKTTAGPPTDTAAQSSPVKPPPKAPVVDDSMQSSPIPEPKPSGVWVAPHTAIHVALGEALDSGKLHNGQAVRARLVAALAAHGKTFPTGTPVDLTVVGTVPAGRMSQVGELSLQVLSVGGVPASTDTLTFRGQPGPRLTPDALPAIGTDASLASGTQITFHVLPPPVPATAPPPNVPNLPGSVISPPRQ